MRKLSAGNNLSQSKWSFWFFFQDTILLMFKPISSHRHAKSFSYIMTLYIHNIGNCLKVQENLLLTTIWGYMSIYISIYHLSIYQSSIIIYVFIYHTDGNLHCYRCLKSNLTSIKSINIHNFDTVIPTYSDLAHRN